MRRRSAAGPALLALLAVAVVPRAAAAQGAGPLIEAARLQIDQLAPDSAATLLRRALSPEAGAAGAQRVRAFTLYGINELLRNNRLAARQAFEQALRLDPALRIDSLAELHSDTRVVFGEARSATAPDRRPLNVAIELPADTVLPPGGRLPIDVRPTNAARVVTSIETPAMVLWTDTQTVDVAGRILWDLRGRDTVPVPDGRYFLRVTARDSLGQVAPLAEQVLVVERIVPDTASLPPPLDPATLLPESRRLARGPVTRLLAAGLLGAGAALAPRLLGAGDAGRGGSGRAFMVAGTVSLAGIAGFFAGHRDQALPGNAARNRERVAADLQARQAIAAANTRLRIAAPLRVRLEGAR